MVEVGKAEQDRALRAFKSHLDLISRIRLDGWKRLQTHKHPQLESEPDGFLLES